MAEKEYNINSQLDHPNVVKCFQKTETHWLQPNQNYDKATVLTLEYVSGGELFDYVACGGAMTERVSRFIFSQLLEGLAYIHS